MQCNGIFGPVIKCMECIHYECSRRGVPKRDYAPYLPCNGRTQNRPYHAWLREN